MSWSLGDDLGTCAPQDPDLVGWRGPCPPQALDNSWATRVCGWGCSSPALTVGVELSAPGVGDARKLARALLGGHALPTGVLVEPLGTDTAGLTLRGHLWEEGQWLLEVAPLAATTALGPSKTPQPRFSQTPPCVHPALGLSLIKAAPPHP